MATPTELQIVSYKNILTIIDRMQTRLQVINDAAKFICALSITGAGLIPTRAAPNPGSIIAVYRSKELVGYAINTFGETGDKYEWLYMISSRVLNGPGAHDYAGAIKQAVNFMLAAYQKSTGRSIDAFKKIRSGLGNEIHSSPDAGIFYQWVKGQVAQLSFKVNDLMQAVDDLQLQLNNVRVPMPDKFQAWIMDLRNTAISVSSGNLNNPQLFIDAYRLFTLSIYKGELVSDINIISSTLKDMINKAVAGATVKPPTSTPVPTATPQPHPTSSPAPDIKVTVPETWAPIPVSSPTPPPMSTQPIKTSAPVTAPIKTPAPVTAPVKTSAPVTAPVTAATPAPAPAPVTAPSPAITQTPVPTSAPSTAAPIASSAGTSPVPATATATPPKKSVVPWLVVAGGIAAEVLKHR